MKLKEFFELEGYDIKTKINNEKNLELWNSWYVGNVKDFHKYFIYNRPGNKVLRHKRTLQMAKKICEDWADLLYNERVKITLGEDKDTNELINIFDKNNLNVIINRGIEKSFALGTGALLVSVDLKTDGNTFIKGDTDIIKIQYADAFKIIPLTWDNDNITECAFMNFKTEKGVKYLYISMHVLNNVGNYVIKNYKFRCDNKDLSPAEDENIIAEFDTQSTIPWFYIIKPNICNNKEIDSPYGISIYANSLSTIMNIDTIYDTKDLEVELGRRRTFVSEDLLTYDDGKGTLVFDPNDISVYVLPKGFTKDMMIQSDNTDLRTDKLIEALNSELNVLASKVGFGQERYKFDRNGLKTATEVISENSDMFRTIKKHEILLENTLKGLVKCICYAVNTFTNKQMSDGKINIDFDDSIIEDKNALKLQAQSEVTQGLRSKKSYLMEIEGLSEKEAEQRLNEINEEKQNNISTFFGNNDLGEE